MNRFLAPVFLILFSGCSLYTDEGKPDIFYTFEDFDILSLGNSIADMQAGPDGNYLYLADYNNHAILQVDVTGSMALHGQVWVGARPVALDISPDQTKLVVALNGESRIVIIDLASFTVVQSVPISLSNVTDLACVTNDLVYVSSATDPSAISLSLADSTETGQSVHSGMLTALPADTSLLVATSVTLKKYRAATPLATQYPFIADPYGFTAHLYDAVLSPDTRTLFIGLGDENNPHAVTEVWAYDTDNLTLQGKYKTNSAGLGIAVRPDGQRVFVAPMDADPAGVFIIEFDTATKLETHYYLVAGNLKAKGLVADPGGRYIYALVNSPGDGDSFEPYNSFSYDLQRIRIVE
ncbi:MAG: YncE family protein [Fidelibacterota bacterium]